MKYPTSIGKEFIMAKSTKTGSNGHHKGTNGSHNGSRRIFDDVLALAGTLARGRKGFGADKLHSLASSTREFAASMTDLPNLRVQVALAADSIESLSDYVLNTEIEQMAGDAGTFARRHPFATLAITVAVGVAASRFIWRQPNYARAGSNRRSTSSKHRAKSSARTRVLHARRGTNGKAQSVA
jgi:hypothetical protein